MALGVRLSLGRAAVTLGALGGALGGLVDLALVGRRDTGTASLAVDVVAAILQTSLLRGGGNPGAGGGGLSRDDDGGAESENSSEAHFEMVLGW